MTELAAERIKKIAHILSEVSHLDETDTFILLELLADSKITLSKLAKIMEFKDGNSVAYHTRMMQDEGIIERYTIVPNWKRIGLPTQFIITAEAENEEQLLDIEKKHIIMLDEYSASYGDVLAIPMISGCVLIQDVYHCYGDKIMGIIIGRASSDQDAAVYCKDYLASRYPGIIVNLLINKYKTISDFFIDRHALLKLKEFLMIEMKGDSSEIIKEITNMKI